MTPASTRILVADDQHIVTTLMTGILKKLGFGDVAGVQNGDAALTDGQVQLSLAI